MKDYRKYKIECLLEMAKRTGSDSKREQYLMEVYELLEELDDVANEYLDFRNGFDTDESVSEFMSDCLEIKYGCTASRNEIYEKYIQYCDERKYGYCSRNYIFKKLRRMNYVTERRNCHERYFLNLSIK